MGWSATAKACQVEQEWAQACHAQTGQSNVYETSGKRFFYDTGREQRDGAITGQVFRMLPDGFAVRSGSFRIEADGTVTRYPTGLRKALRV